MKLRAACLVVGFLSLSPSLAPPTVAQTVAESASALPRLVRFGGTAKDIDGHPLAGVVGITFALYSEQTGGAALWLETQNVTADSNGRYVALLGSTKPDGLPTELFTSEQARWVGVQISGQSEQPRVLLVSAPYALKALDAETVGGKPASAFMAAPNSSSSISNDAAVAKGAVARSGLAPALGGGGTKDYVPLWLSSTKLGSSKLFQSAAGKIGVGTTSPAATLDVSGTGNVRDTLTLFPKSNDPTLSVSGTAFSVSNTGLVSFVSGQRFPGTGDGTITGVTAGTDLTGGGTTGNVTVNLDTTKVPRLSAANTFTANQTVNGTLTASSSGITVNAASSSTSGPAVEGSGSFEGVLGIASAGSGVGFGVQGVSGSTSGTGVGGYSVATTGSTYGVYGSNTSNSGMGIYGTSPYIGVEGAATDIGVYGVAGSPSIEGSGKGLRAGVWGDIGGNSASYAGVVGTADDNYAGYFASDSGAVPTMFVDNDDVTAGDEVFVAYMLGVNALATIGDPGCNTGFIALQLGQQGMSDCINYTLAGGNNGHTYINAVSGSAVHLRVNSVDQVVVTNGNTDIMGTLTKPAGSFKIDHPLDPANKYLYHSFVESPDMKNMYDGNVTTDDAGLATVTLPNWFETLNRDFRYQLTVIGQFAQAIVASEVSGNQFSIRTDKPNVKVSWQVTGTRQDAFANAHRIQVEVEKAPADRGHYLYPELVGAPETARIGYMAASTGKIVHHRPTFQRRGSASPLRQTTPSIPIPPMPVAPKVVPMPHPVTPSGKLATNQSTAITH
jgi:hypothetical protein